MSRFIIKKIQEKPISKRKYLVNNFSNKKNIKDNELDNNIKNKQVMDTKEKIEMAKKVLSQETERSKFKKVKKDKGLIERTENSVTVLTEDNKELLKD